ncbi:uncharacterized protein insb [Ochlerotatus camptorhynchus]|uniref:uncharacterized protein insb n=1 Tax=Ochlerotatus camptorhynchus TaxID=644619 RepID=UPI0031D2EAFE
MPKTVPKSTKNNDLAESRRLDHQHHHQRQHPGGGGGERSKVKRRHSELEPNEDSGEPSKRPNRTDPDQIANQLPEQPVPASPGGSDFLLQALRRIQELQDEIDFLENDPYAEDADSSENDDDGYPPMDGAVVVGHQAEALGFAVCARETMAFLEREGVPVDSPIMVSLRSRLVGRCEQNMSC